MVKKKDVEKPVYVFEFFKIKLTFRALIIIAVTTVVIIFLIKFGYDPARGCYSDAGKINVNINEKIRE